MDEFGLNIGYLVDLYDRWKRDPALVDAESRNFLEHWAPPGDGQELSKLLFSGAQVESSKVASAVQLAQSIRAYGHLAAQLDPLGSPPRGDPALDQAAYGLTDDDLRRMPARLIGGPAGQDSANAFEAIGRLKKIYCSTVGYDYDDVHIPSEREWLRHVTEAGAFCPPGDPVNPLALLERLTQVETFERFLHRVFPGKTRFSLEGLDMMVPMLDEVISGAAEAGIRNVIIGMAHRGRLNVLAHVLGKPYPEILAEFRDPARGRDFAARETLGWTGDVKYHAGARRSLENGKTLDLVITIPPNPSHVESADPIVEGMARAAGTESSQAGPPRFTPSVALPILIHGDAAFSGQGIVAETLNLSRLDGYETGGTIHLIANNQLGYTTEPAAARSTLYASDLAKGYEMPVIHVNADDVEACVEAARIAQAYRREFNKDFVIDLVGYRRYGHNEGDEPSFTQPLLYEKISSHPTVRQLWAENLDERGGVSPDASQELQNKYSAELQKVFESMDPEKDLVEPIPEQPPPRAAQKVRTAVALERLRELNAALLRLPTGFTPNPKLERAMRRRQNALEQPDEKSIDWATSEQLAFASVLADGIPIRLTGEDVERGTFGHRHSVFHDIRTGQTFIPLQSVPQAKAAFAVYDSPLSENAVLAFEYGYNIHSQSELVLWEAQYGDFVDAAQMVIDEFIVSARAKWGQTPSLGLLLPHGFEGAGPDHSSARLERFLELAAETNVRIANPTTAGQYFHLLRRQAALLGTDPLPLVVMTPKSLLRHPLSASSPRELFEGVWQPIIVDPPTNRDRKTIRSLVLCSGKVFVDLVSSEQYKNNSFVSIVRIEQLYPFPDREIREHLVKLTNLEQVIWLQEEPENMGAWNFVRPRLAELMNGQLPLRYVGRLPNASPAEGSLAQHNANQKRIIEKVFADEKQDVTV